MDTSSGRRKRKSLVDGRRKSKVSSKAGSSDEDEWLCARTFKASKIDKGECDPNESSRKAIKRSNEVVENDEKESAKWINRKSLDMESVKPKGLIATKSDVKNRISQIEKVWNVHPIKKKNVIEEVTPQIRQSSSIVSNASDVVPDSCTSTCSSSSSTSTKKSDLSNKPKRSPFPKIKSQDVSQRSPFPKSKSHDITQERLLEKQRPTCESPVLPCTPIRTSHVRKLSQVVHNVSFEESPKLLGFPSLQSPEASQVWKNRRNSLGSLGSKITSSSQSTASDTPKRSNRRCSLVNFRIEAAELFSPKREANPVILETLDIMSPLRVQKKGVLDKVVIDSSQVVTPCKPSVFKVPITSPQITDQSTPDIEESCSGFQIQETCHIGLSEGSSTSGLLERFDIDDLDGKSIRCDDYTPKLISAPVAIVRENQLRKRLPKLAGRLAKHLSSIRCDRLIVRRDPRAVIISLPISQTYSNWGLTVHEVSGTGQLVIVRDKLQSSRIPTSITYSNNRADYHLASLQTDSKIAEKDVKVSKSLQIVPPPSSISFSSSAGSALRAVVGAGTDSASSSAAVECWLHLAQPYSLIRTSSRQPPAIINPIVIDR